MPGRRFSPRSYAVGPAPLTPIVRCETMRRDLTNQDWKGLWAVLWRLALFGTILLPVCIALLTFFFAFLLVPPVYAILVFAAGDEGSLHDVVWLASMAFGRRLLRRLFAGMSEGWEYGSI